MKSILCGISEDQIIAMAEQPISYKTAAKRLGVDYSYLRRTLKRTGLDHLFRGRSYGKGTKRPLLTKEDLESVAGLTKKDAAHVLGVCRCTVTALAQRYDLMHLFPNKGKAKQLALKGYTL